MVLAHVTVNRRSSILLRLLALLVFPAACSQPELAPVTQSAPDLPTDRYEQAELEGARVYQISSAESVVLIYVTRAGRMKHLGHDHVVASENLNGFVRLTDELVDSSADLQLALRGLVVDKPAYRAAFGLEPDVSASAKDGTYRNMQAGVLESAEYPYARISAEYLTGDIDKLTLNVEIELHGTTAHYQVPVELELSQDRLSVTGEMAIKHSDFNLKPFSAVGGLLSVGEPMKLRFSIVAYRTRLLARLDFLPSICLTCAIAKGFSA